MTSFPRKRESISAFLESTMDARLRGHDDGMAATCLAVRYTAWLSTRATLR